MKSQVLHHTCLVILVVMLLSLMVACSQTEKAAISTPSTEPPPTQSPSPTEDSGQEAVKHYNLGVEHRRQGKLDLAIEEYTQAIKLKPDYAEAYLGRGNAYYDKGDYDHAIADYGQAIKLRPDYARAYDNRGLAYYSKGDYDRAIVDLCRYLELLPNAPDRKVVEELIRQLEVQK